MIVIPKRGMGRPTAAKAEAYRDQVKAFCREIKKLRASLDFEVSARARMDRSSFDRYICLCLLA
jgi:hypothetical protein